MYRVTVGLLRMVGVYHSDVGGVDCMCLLDDGRIAYYSRVGWIILWSVCDEGSTDTTMMCR